MYSLLAANEVAEGNVFTPVCLSIGGGQMSLTVWSHVLSGGGGLPPEGVLAFWHILAYLPEGHLCQKASGRRTPPPRQADTAVGSMHPTGMHSCFHCTSTFRTPQMHSQARSIDMFCYVSLLWTKITYKVYLVQSSRIIIFRQKINFCF